MFFVYIIQSYKNSRYYIGYTKDLRRRLTEHNSNNTKSLKNRGPFKLVYKEEAPTLVTARKREKEIKSYKGGAAFKRLISQSAED